MTPALPDEAYDETFEGMDVKGERLSGKTFDGCAFRDCNLSGADLQSTRFLGCHFERCDLSNVRVRGATLREIVAKDCKMLGIDFTAAAQFVSPKFENCVLSYASFVQMDVKKAKFDGCIFREADFSNANMQEVSCVGADFAGAVFKRTILAKADFRRAIGYALDASECNVRGMKASLPEALTLLNVLGVKLD